MKIKLLNALSIAIAAIGLAFAAPHQAVSQVRENAAQVLAILQQADGSNDMQIRQQAEEYAMPYFDFERMTALAVGRPWRNADAAQKQALTEQFRTLLIRTYSGTMLKLKNAQVVVHDRPTVSRGGKEVTVRVEISQIGNKPINMDFTAYQSGDRYRVYNVAVEGASLVTVYRNQFGQIIHEKSLNGLINELKSKNSSQ